MQSKERVQQIKDKINRKQKLTNEENLIMIEWKKQLDEAQRVEDEKMAKQHRADMDANTYIKDQVGIIEIRMVMKFQVMIIINTVST